MADEEHRHGMSEFHSRMSVVETKVESMQSEIREFKEDFHDHDVIERQDRKDIINELKTIRGQLNRFDGWKAGVVFALMTVGALVALAFKKLFGG